MINNIPPNAPRNLPKNLIKQIILNCFKNQTKVHIILKDKTFRNGLIKNMQADFLIIRKLEDIEEPIFYLEIEHVKPYVERDKIGENNGTSRTQ